jgi:hypothetical protein
MIAWANTMRPPPQSREGIAVRGDRESIREHDRKAPADSIARRPPNPGECTEREHLVGTRIERHVEAAAERLGRRRNPVRQPAVEIRELGRAGAHADEVRVDRELAETVGRQELGHQRNSMSGKVTFAKNPLANGFAAPSG